MKRILFVLHAYVIHVTVINNEDFKMKNDMKIILNEWRRFVESTNIIRIDESQMTPKILSTMLIENESLSQTDSDPQSISVEELEKQSPEFFKAQMKDMEQFDQNVEKVKQRIENDKALISALGDVRHEIEVIDYRNETGAGVITNFIDWTKSVTNSLLGTKFKSSEEIDQEKLEQLKSKKEEISVKFRDALISIYNPYQREIFRAILLFTGANYEQIRNPDTFDPTLAKMQNFVNDGIRDIFMPSRETYVKARIILRKLAGSSMDQPVNVYRGLAMYLEDRDGYQGLASDDYKVGSIIQIEKLSSFTVDKSIATDFIERNTGDGVRWGVLLHIPELLNGVDVNSFSEFEGTENEVISYGKFRVKQMKYISRDEEGIPSQVINNIQDLLKGKSESDIEDMMYIGHIEIILEQIIDKN
jgi:hypothetical protein